MHVRVKSMRMRDAEGVNAARCSRRCHCSQQHVTVNTGRHPLNNARPCARREIAGKHSTANLEWHTFASQGVASREPESTTCMIGRKHVNKQGAETWKTGTPVKPSAATPASWYNCKD